MSVFTLTLISISFYLFVIFILYLFALISNRMVFVIKNKKISCSRYGLFFIFVGTSICTFYDLYITKTSINMGGDRLNYLYEFNNSRGILTLGLQKFMDWFHLFSNDFTLFVIFICFICVSLTLIAYRFNNNSTPIVIFLLFSSQYLFSIFVNFKQCFANAFSAIFFAMLFSQKGAKRDVICIITIVLACIFHEASIILVPIYILCKNMKNRHIGIWFGLFLILMLFLDKFAIMGAQFLSPFAPEIAAKINLYFADISGVDSSFIILLKGIPYYIILYLAVKWRNQMVKKIENYDNYLLITICIVFLQIGALWSYWLPRAQCFLYLPVFTLFGQIIEKTDKTKVNRYLKTIVCGSVLFFSLRDLILIYLRYGGF